jgi:hypothetical protein
VSKINLGNELKVSVGASYSRNNAACHCIFGFVMGRMSVVEIADLGWHLGY